MSVMALLAPSLDELLEKVRPLIVVVRDGRHGAGAGVLIEEGRVLTNAHVVRHDHNMCVVLENDQAFDARLLARDPQVDLALLQIPTNGHPEAVLASGPPRPGEIVYAIGHPWGQRNMLTGGVLSALTSARTPNGEIPLLRTDLHLAPGYSGGPLLNAAGEVIGLNAMIFGGDQCLAIPASLILSFLEQTIAKQEVLL